MFTFHKATNSKSQGQRDNSLKLTRSLWGEFLSRKKKKIKKTFIITSKKIEIQYDFNKFLDKLIPWPLK